MLKFVRSRANISNQTAFQVFPFPIPGEIMEGFCPEFIINVEWTETPCSMDKNLDVKHRVGLELGAHGKSNVVVLWRDVKPPNLVSQGVGI